MGGVPSVHRYAMTGMRFRRSFWLEKGCGEGWVLVCFGYEMANTINIPKTHLIMGLSLPLAVLLGYFVAEPMELGSMAVVVFVLVALSIPLLMKSYYLLLVLSWNAAMSFGFLPGQPAFWAMMAFIGLLFAIVSRAVSADARFLIEPSVTKSLLALLGVVVVTAMATGGFGVRMLGAGQYGGKNYFYFLAAIAGYFVFTSRRIPPHRAGLYVALFFLSGLTFAVSDLAGLGGSNLAFLKAFLTPVDSLSEAALGETLGGYEQIHRIVELSSVAAGCYCYLLARFGFRGLLDLTRPWRLLLLLLVLAAGLLSGFRSFVLLGGLTFALVFYLEGLHRTRYAAVLLGIFLLGSVIVLPQAGKLPLMVQRTISFLPGKFDWTARESAANSTEWRMQMWKEVLPDVPKHLFQGTGWGIDARDFQATVGIAGWSDSHAGTILVGNFHNGPLSILMPFGVYGVIAFVWFLVAGLRVLHRNWKFGDPALRNVNALLLAAFAARSIWFFFFFGSLHSDMAFFAGVMGLGVALNGTEVAPVLAEQPATGMEFQTEYVKV